MANGGPTLPGRTNRSDGVEEIGVGSVISEHSSDPNPDNKQDTAKGLKRPNKKKDSKDKQEKP